MHASLGYVYARSSLLRQCHSSGILVNMAVMRMPGVTCLGGTCFQNTVLLGATLKLSHHKSHQQYHLCCDRQKMEQARVQEETQMKVDHARRLKQMRLSLEDEKRKRSEENARLRRQLELKQVHFLRGCLMKHQGPPCMAVLNCGRVRSSAPMPDQMQPCYTSWANNSCQLSLQQIYRHIALSQYQDDTTSSCCVSSICLQDESFAV